MAGKGNGDGGPGASYERVYAQLALAWHGWGSPVGLGLFLVSSGTAALLVRWAIAGF
jgi:hypothetical protein